MSNKLILIVVLIVITVGAIIWIALTPRTDRTLEEVCETYGNYSIKDIPAKCIEFFTPSQRSIINQ